MSYSPVFRKFPLDRDETSLASDAFHASPTPTPLNSPVFENTIPIDVGTDSEHARPMCDGNHCYAMNIQNNLQMTDLRNCISK